MKRIIPLVIILLMVAGAATQIPRSAIAPVVRWITFTPDTGWPGPSMVDSVARPLPRGILYYDSTTGFWWCKTTTNVGGGAGDSVLIAFPVYTGSGGGWFTYVTLLNDTSGNPQTTMKIDSTGTHYTISDSSLITLHFVLPAQDPNGDLTRIDSTYPWVAFKPFYGGAWPGSSEAGYDTLSVVPAIRAKLRFVTIEWGRQSSGVNDAVTWVKSVIDTVDDGYDSTMYSDASPFFYNKVVARDTINTSTYGLVGQGTKSIPYFGMVKVVFNHYIWSNTSGSTDNGKRFIEIWRPGVDNLGTTMNTRIYHIVFDNNAGLRGKYLSYLRVALTFQTF